MLEAGKFFRENTANSKVLASHAQNGWVGWWAVEMVVEMAVENCTQVDPHRPAHRYTKLHHITGIRTANQL